MKIGLFDSGIGGVSVLKKLTYLNGAHYIYIADTERAPYGIKTPETLETFVFQFIDFFERKNVEEIFAACNTTDSIILERGIKFDIKYHSIVRAGVNASKSKNVGVIGTNITIKNETYKKQLELLGKNVQQKAAQLFVSLVEEGIFYGRMVEAIANFYLNSFRKTNIDELILGCTHFPFLKGIISRVLPRVKIIDPAEELSKEIPVNKTKKPFVEFYVTGDVKEFEKKLKRINFRVPHVIHKLETRKLKVITVEKVNNIDWNVRSG
ncbi:MAG: glutamate racemase [Thermosipho sp. (in: Bacteria)]|nr:glutamate racemase [Thermosipho sp. (in: thermotogales)]